MPPGLWIFLSMVLFKEVGFGTGFICSRVKKFLPMERKSANKKKFGKIYVGYVIDRNDRKPRDVSSTALYLKDKERLLQSQNVHPLILQ